MPYTTTWVDPDVFLKHKDVTIYHTYKDDDYDNGPRSFWYGFDVMCSDDGRDSFDIRDLDGYSDELDHAEIIERAIDNGQIQRIIAATSRK